MFKFIKRFSWVWLMYVGVSGAQMRDPTAPSLVIPRSDVSDTSIEALPDKTLTPTVATDLQLTSIIKKAAFKQAIINQKALKLGESIADLKLVAIGQSQVTLRATSGDEVVLPLGKKVTPQIGGVNQ